VTLARENLHADERKYELGAEPVFFVLDAQTQLAQAELNVIQAQVNFQVAVAQLDPRDGEFVGAPSRPDHGTNKMIPLVPVRERQSSQAIRTVDLLMEP